MPEPEPLEIVLYPDPFLTKPCREITAAELKAGVADGWNLAELVDRMRVTMYKAEGIGLAAPQVRVGLRLFVGDISKDKSGFFVLINPVFSNTAGSVNEEEGCLSIPGVRGKVKRFNALTASGVNLQGESIVVDATELLARVCQHETDHLNGVLFISRVGMASRVMLRRKLAELEEDYALAQKKKK